MKSNLIYLVLALITGALIPIQAATNAAFSKSIGNASITGLMVFLVGLVGMIVFVLISRVAMPSPQQLVDAPIYGYFGGLIVATYVVMITILVPRIGVGTAIGFIVTGQILFAVVIDHFGLFNVATRLIDTTRFVGVTLIVVGVYLVMKK
ncbi:DMT family transporter [Aurantibacillus circumpalustris]|uniref:DMT family transporter n=1 Tax=Aurantibacillus circumpalustris TaxID=3036359 RepID=UPI00295BF08D|nr:DMT family transporter [Aurantibacillus circumpalustris]